MPSRGEEVQRSLSLSVRWEGAGWKTCSLVLLISRTGWYQEAEVDQVVANVPRRML